MKLSSKWKRVPAVPALCALSACSTSLTNLADPHALQPGHVEVTVAGQASASSVLLSEAAGGVMALPDVGADLSGTIDPLQPTSSQRELVDGALAIGLFAPSLDPELMLRCGVPAGPLPGADLGLRLSPAVLKLDAKLQLLESERGRHALALQTGLGWHHGGAMKAEWLEWLALSNYERYDLDLLLTWGWRWPDVGEAYAGPRALISAVTAERKLEAHLFDLLPAELAKYDPSQLMRDEWMYQVGATAGLKLGYKHVFARLELSACYLWFRPQILGEQRVFDGIVVSPSVALSGSW